jgi:hypothetical protein
MKKIIALAIAGAFVAPAFAADVTLSGDVEYVFANYKNDGTSASTGDADFTITATEEVNGISITAYIENEAGTQDGAVTFSGSFGSVKVGDDSFMAADQVDEKADVAEVEMGDSNIASATTRAANIMWTLPAMVDGLTAMVSSSYAAGTNDAASDDETTVTSYAVQYTTGGVTAAYGVVNDDGVTYEPTFTGLSYAVGPIYVAYQVTANDGAANTDISALGAKYNYGQGNLYVESQTTDTNGVKTNDTAVGVSYAIGGANIYVQSNTGDTEADNGSFFGVEYAF